jgi:hypothetical protein
MLPPLTMKKSNSENILQDFVIEFVLFWHFCSLTADFYTLSGIYKNTSEK